MSCLSGYVDPGVLLFKSNIDRGSSKATKFAKIIEISEEDKKQQGKLLQNHSSTICRIERLLPSPFGIFGADKGGNDVCRLGVFDLQREVQGCEP